MAGALVRRLLEVDLVNGDPHLALMDADMDRWLALEALNCECDDVCVCGWDDDPALLVAPMPVAD